MALQLTGSRRLAVAMGHEWPATLSATTACFAGWTAGAWILSGQVRRSPCPWLWATALQALGAAWALASVPLLGWLGEGSVGWIGTEPGAVRHAWVSLGAGIMGVFPGAFLLGSTFAAFERSMGILCDPQGTRSGGHVGALYAWNALGSMMGVALAMTWLQPAFGMAGATCMAAAGSMAAGWMAWLAGRGASPTSPTSPDGRGKSPEVNAAVQETRGPRRIHPASEQGGTLVPWLLLGGLLGMGLQVVTVRVLAPVMGGTVYSMAWVLGGWLGGTAWGAAPWTRGWTARGLGLLWVAAMAAGGCCIEAGGRWLTSAAGNAGFWETCLMEGALVAVGVAPMAAASAAWLVGGMERAMAAGMDSGKAWGWNLAGASAAPALLGAVAVPWLGDRGAWTGLLAMALGLALFLALKEETRRVRRLAWAGSGLALAAVALAPRFDPSVMPPGVQRVRRVVGMSDTVEVWRWPDRSRTLMVNHRMSMGGTGTASVAERQAHLPLILHPSPGSALFLGVGTGMTMAGARAHPEVRAVGVELVPEVVRVLGEFAPENSMGPRSEVVTADARRYLRAPGPRFDVIMGDLFHPERDGAAWLYTEEHFRAMRGRLAPGGVACQWLPWFQLDERSRAMVVASWLKVFPGSDAWLLRWTSLDTPVVGLVHGGQPPSPAEWTRRVGGRGSLRDALARCGLADAWQFWGCWLGPLSLLSMPSPGENTDDRPAVLWSAARGASGARDDARSSLLGWLETASASMPSWASEDRGSGERWDRMRRARDSYLRGLDAWIGGRAEEAQAAMWRSIGQSADFPSAYSHLVEQALAKEKQVPGSGRVMLERLAKERPEIPVGRELLDRLGRRPGP